MEQIKNQIIAAIVSGNLEEAKELKQKFDEAVAADKWLQSFTDGSIPISAWLEPNPFITWK